MSVTNPFAAVDTGCGCEPNTRGGAFAPVTQGPINVAGLVQTYEPGNRATPMVSPQHTPGTFTPLAPGTRWQHLRARLGFAQNYRPLISFALGGHPSPVGAVRPVRFPTRRPNPPAAIPGVSTWWPRAIPTFPTYGGPPS